MDSHILALETSSSICGVAILSSCDGERHVHALSHDGTGEHAQRLLPMVDEVLARAGIRRHELTAIAFGQGPGGFTGLRVACGVAQGMAFGLALPVIPVSSLLAAASRARSEYTGAAPANAVYVCVQDARMGEVYLAAYQAGDSQNDDTWQERQSPILIDAAGVQGWLNVFTPGPHGSATPVVLCGDALEAYPYLAQAGGAEAPGRLVAGAWRADAASVARLALAAFSRGEAVAPDDAMPLYVRDKVAYTVAERAQGAGGNPRAPAFDVTVLPMEEHHLDAVAAIESRVQSFPWTRRNFADGLQAGYAAWVVCQNGLIVGFCMAMMAPDVAHLLVIGVDPDFQGKGRGRLLLRHCESEALRRGLDTVVLEVRQSNHAAIGFYRREGFHAFTTRKGYYPAPHGEREDADVMKKQLYLPAAAS